MEPIEFNDKSKLSLFKFEDLLAIHFINSAQHIPLGNFRYQHKFLYIVEGTGIVKLDHDKFDFVDGSLYAFRTARSVEVISSVSISAVLIVFNTIPFPDRKVSAERTWQLRTADNVIQLMPITSEIFEHRISDPNDRDSISALAKVVQREVNTPMQYSDEIILNTALNIIRIAVRADSQHLHSAMTINLPSSILEIMEDISAILKKNKKATIPQIAMSLNTTPCALNRKFIKDSGMTLANYVREIRYFSDFTNK